MGNQSPDEAVAARLVPILRELLEAEEALAERCHDVAVCVTQHAGAAALVADAGALARAHAAAIGVRIAELGSQRPAGTVARAERRAEPALEQMHPAAAAVRCVAVMTYEALVSAAALLHLAIRRRDSWIAAAEGTTAHLARRHVQEYQSMLGRVPGVLCDVLLAELQAAEDYCLCICPACSLGLCMCGQPVIWREAHMAAHQAMQSPFIAIPQPRPGSAAAAVGLRTGDSIAAIDGVTVDSIATLMTSLKSAAPGTDVVLTVRRGEGEFRTRVQKPAEHGALPEIAKEASDCLQPSGQDFYLDRARDLQRVIRRGGKPVAPHPDGVHGLTARELQVLRFIADGATNPMIGEKLRIRRPTVARHVASILAKLGATNRTDAAAMAAAQGFRSDA